MIAYKITNTVNGKAYIGITSRLLRVRWAEHCHDANRGRTWPLQCAIRKYGKDTFRKETIARCATFDELKKMEVALIEEHGTFINGYNASRGGDGNVGWVPSAEMRETVRRKNLGLKRSPETCERIGAAKRGKTLSPEHRAKLSLAHKGKNRGSKSPEHRRKISMALTGKKLSPWRVERMAAGHRGLKRPPPTDTARVNMSAAQQVRVLVGCVEYASYPEAGRAHGVSRYVISNWVRDGRATRLGKRSQIAA